MRGPFTVSQSDICFFFVNVHCCNLEREFGGVCAPPHYPLCYFIFFFFFFFFFFFSRLRLNISIKSKIIQVNLLKFVQKGFITLILNCSTLLAFHRVPWRGNSIRDNKMVTLIHKFSTDFSKMWIQNFLETRWRGGGLLILAEKTAKRYAFCFDPEFELVQSLKRKWSM